MRLHYGLEVCCFKLAEHCIGEALDFYLNPFVTVCKNERDKKASTVSTVKRFNMIKFTKSNLV